MLTVLWEVCGSERGNVHAVEDFHVLLDVCGRTLWSGGHVRLWTLWWTWISICYQFQCKFVNVSSRKREGELQEVQVCQPWLVVSFPYAGESTALTLAAGLSPVQWRTQHMHLLYPVSKYIMLYIQRKDYYRLISIMEQDKLIEDCDVAEMRLQLSISGWSPRQRAARAMAVGVEWFYYHYLGP